MPVFLALGKQRPEGPAWTTQRDPGLKKKKKRIGRIGKQIQVWSRTLNELDPWPGLYF